MGYFRFTGETDERVRSRIMAYGQNGTLGFVEGLVQDVLSDGSYPAATFTPWHEGNHYIAPTDGDLGLFVGVSRVPVTRGVIVEIDSSVPASVIASIVYILNERMAFGFFYVIVLV